MSNDRKQYNEPEHRVLYNQVNGICPLCAIGLHYSKDGSIQKAYEVAHIYPLNPTAKEIEILKNEKRLSNDVNSLDNVIALCRNCHVKFDKPRTVEEYKFLYGIKQQLIENEKIINIYHSYAIEVEIMEILNALNNDLGEDSETLDYKVIKVDQKLKKDVNLIFRRRIKRDVSDYYLFIKSNFAEMDKNKSTSFDLIASQIKTMYLKIQLISDNQESIYNHLAEWLFMKTQKGSVDTCKVIISFFVQSCEVFSDVTKQSN